MLPGRGRRRGRLGARLFITPDYGGARTADIEGRTLTKVGAVDSGWDAEDVITCTGATELVAVTGDRRGRLAIAALMLFGVLLGSVLAGVGYASRRSHQR